MFKYLTKLFGNQNEKIIKGYLSIVEKINALESSITPLTDEQLREKTALLKERVQKNNESLDMVLPEAFALVREGARRTIGQRHYDVQMLGGLALHQGKIAEMRTGEGKTLVATLPLFLNALSGKGAHLVTVNDYLAQRDCAWMGQIYHILGLTVGCIAHESAYQFDPTHKKEEVPEDEREKSTYKILHDHLRPVSRREAYQCDIVYGTNNEYGFDYLRDNLVYSIEQMSQRELNFAIVDEVDSILIDEARTPLIISQPDFEATKRYEEYARYVEKLSEADFTIDYKQKAVSLTEQGIETLSTVMGRDPYKEGDVATLHHITQALRAKTLFHLDKEYVVRNNEVIIVDEFTGRMLHGRRFSEGLHQAIEAKENVKVQAESKTLATITFQNYFRLYKKLAGMTGTAETSSEEFFKVYNLEVVVIPTNKPMVRNDNADKIYKSESAKFNAIVKEVLDRYTKGQPVLIGTRSIEKNEELAKVLRKASIPFNMLNAKNHEKEGEIIAQAGKLKQVTIATNMAGRGVDILLGGNPADPEERKKVLEVGGLFVLGTERHEARRIDNQLRGRAGRQGDVGESQFIVSLDDEILRVLGGERLKSTMTRFNLPEDEPIQHSFISSLIEKAQAKIETLNFDVRKHVLEYDDVLNVQRKTIYRLRLEVLRDYEDYLKNKSNTLTERFFEYVKEYIVRLQRMYMPTGTLQSWDFQKVADELKIIIKSGRDIVGELKEQASQGLSPEAKHTAIAQYIEKALREEFAKKTELVGADVMHDIMRVFMLQNIDFFWQEHLTVLQDLREAVRLRAYGQRDPLVEYKTEARRHFAILLDHIRTQVVEILFKIELKPREETRTQKPIELKREEVTIGNPESSEQLSNSGATQPLPTGPIKSQKHTYYRAPQKDEKYANVGRNDPCPCGSGKKFKKCHGKN